MAFQALKQFIRLLDGKSVETVVGQDSANNSTKIVELQSDVIFLAEAIIASPNVQLLEDDARRYMH